MNESRLQTVLTILPVVSAGLYLLGATYQQGYLDGFGLEDSLFPLAIEKALLSGFIAFISFGLVPMLYALFAILALFFTVLVAAVLSSTSRVKHWQTKVAAKLRSMRSKSEPSPTMNSIVDRSGSIYGYIAGAFLLIFSLLIVAVLSTKSGREQAQKEIEAFKDKKGNWVMLYTGVLPAPTRAKQIICSTSHCAFWLGGEAIILRHENVEHIVTHNASFQGTSASGLKH
jgi:hypothetical protein